MCYVLEHMYETAPSFSSSATPVVGYKADNSDTNSYEAYLANEAIVVNYSATIVQHAFLCLCSRIHEGLKP